MTAKSQKRTSARGQSTGRPQATGEWPGRRSNSCGSCLSREGPRHRHRGVPSAAAALVTPPASRSTTAALPERACSPHDARRRQPQGPCRRHQTPRRGGRPSAAPRARRRVGYSSSPMGSGVATSDPRDVQLAGLLDHRRAAPGAKRHPHRAAPGGRWAAWRPRNGQSFADGINRGLVADASSGWGRRTGRFDPAGSSLVL
jgi:hypothetical protein